MKLATHYIDPGDASTAKNKLCEAGIMAGFSPLCNFWYRIKSRIFELSKYAYQISVMVTFTIDMVIFVIKTGN